MKRLKWCIALLLSLIFGLSGVLQPYALYAETLDLAQEEPKVSQPATESASNASSNTSVDQMGSDSAAQDSSTPDSSEAADAEATSDEDSNKGANEASDEASDADVVAPLAENSWRYVDGSLRSDLPDDYGANADFEGRAMHSMPKGATAQGIDVSEHNGTIDWQSAKDAGIDFAILRVGFAGDTNGGRLDYYFKRNVSECERLGIPYGVYLYSYARNEADAQAEARLMLSALKGHSPTLPVYYDLEEQKTNDDGSPTWTPFNDPSKLASIAKTFCGQIAAAGYKPGIYANVNWFKNYLTDPCFLSSGWSIWTAQYWYGGRYDECLGLTPDAPAKYDCWQYSSRGSVPGVSSDVDVNYWFGVGLGDHWEETDEGKYYVSSNGQPYKGWKLISGVWYWFDPAKGGAMATGLHECNGSMYYFRSSGAMATGWVRDGGSWYYAGEGGALASGWLNLNGAWYWLDPETRAMVTGMLRLGDNAFWLDPSNGGAMASGWVRDGGSWYYAGEGGALASGWLSLSGAWYWLDPSTRAMATGVQTIGSCEYIFNSSGKMMANCWSNGDGSWMYHSSSGGAIDLKGIMTDSGIQLVDDDGNVRTGWIECQGSRYYCSANGVILTGWQQIAGSWYYFNSDGRMATGWLNDGGNWFWLDSASGIMKTGWLSLGGAWYYLDAARGGVMLSNGWYWIGSTDYKFSSSGAMVGAWVDVPCYSQYPELPTGCESVALTNLLNYYGFGLGKTIIADYYLPKGNNGNFVTAFDGNPRRSSGGLMGCVAPAITIACNNFLRAAGSGKQAKDVSFSSISSIKNRLTCGQPVEMWNTVWGSWPGGRYASRWYNGHSYGLWGGNHAVVLKGYDDEQGIVYLSDSINGNVTRNAQVFFGTWQQMDSQAVVIE